MDFFRVKAKFEQCNIVYPQYIYIYTGYIHQLYQLQENTPPGSNGGYLKIEIRVHLQSKYIDNCNIITSQSQ